MTTDWSKRGQALRDGKPSLTAKSAARGVNHVGHPVAENARGTVYAPRNPMHDKEQPGQEEHRSDPIKTSKVLKGVR
jgi:hypothetical protein